MNAVRHSSWSSAHHRAPTTDLLLLRHGETPLTPQRRFSGTGSDDPGLSDIGRSQAEQAAHSDLLAGAGLTTILTSPLRRCRETADIVSAALDLPVEVDGDLREMDFGQWEGLTFAEVEQRHPIDLAAWRTSADAAPTGSSETFAGLLRRIAAAGDRISSSHPDAAVLVVSHVTPIKAFTAHALSAPPTAFFAMELSPAALCRITYAGTDAVLRSFNDTSHLEAR